MILIPKYVVYKIADDPAEGNGLGNPPLPQGEFFVLRKQDMLAVQTLWAYVGVLRTASDVLTTTANGLFASMYPSQAKPLQIESKRLEELANDIVNMASLWEDFRDTKLPD